MLSFLIPLQAQDCPGGASKYVVYHFELPSCPKDTFALPYSGAEAAYKVSVVENSSAWCPGFTGYTLFENGKERMQPAVRLNRGQSCSLDVA